MRKNIKESLNDLFEEKRIVFWYDEKEEMKEEFRDIQLDNVEKIKIDNNEFSIKYKILKEQPKQKFLIYKTKLDKTKNEENWLIDVELYSRVYNADKIKIWMNELKLPPHFYECVKEHRIFFNSEKRINLLKKKIKKEPDIESFKEKLLLVITESEEGIEGLVSKLFEESFLQKEDKLKLIRKCNLEEFMWSWFQREYHYGNLEPNIKDFALELFNSCFKLSIHKNGTLNEEALLLFKRWKNNKNNFGIFEGLSKEFEKVLKIKENIINLNFKELLDFDFFKEIDCFIIKNLVIQIKEKTISNIEVIRILEERRKTYWFDEHQNIYFSLLYASEFLDAISNLNLNKYEFNEYLNVYSRSLFKIDQLYRKFIFYYRKSSQPTLLGDINNLIENQYVNEFLLKVNNDFQKNIDELNSWESKSIDSQRSFYNQNIKKFTEKNKKCIVIISDALRFEIGDELNNEIAKLDKFNSKITPFLASLPSYTQIGMASLLPPGELGIPMPDKPNVTHNLNPSGGIINRRKILDKEIPKDNPYVAKVIDFLDLKIIDLKETIREHNVIYLYHDRIDAVGDSKKTEVNVFEAVQNSIDELIKLVKKIAVTSSINIFITSDHGFIYQNRDIEDSDYLSVSPEAEKIFHYDRRFILGKNFKESQSFKKFTSEELNIKGNFEVLFPKSINRLRKKGSGSRFVHGGISLQEVIIPVINVTKTNTKESHPVGVSILTGSSRNITTSQISIKLYQESPIDNNNTARILLIGLFSKDKKLISNQVPIHFDSMSENSRDREQTIQLILTKSADKYNNQEVTLKLEEKYKNTSHLQTYKSTKFIIKRTFTNDFDF